MTEKAGPDMVNILMGIARHRYNHIEMLNMNFDVNQVVITQILQWFIYFQATYMCAKFGPLAYVDLFI